MTVASRVDAALQGLVPNLLAVVSADRSVVTSPVAPVTFWVVQQGAASLQGRLTEKSLTVLSHPEQIHPHFSDFPKRYSHMLTSCSCTSLFPVSKLRRIQL